MTVGSQLLAYKVFNDLKGNWILERFKDTELIAKANVSLSQLTDNFLFYREEGTLLPEQTNFYREYEYRLDANIIKVFFVNQENKIFHALNFSLNQGLLVANATHNCGMDIYRVNYTFYSVDELGITYKVYGPNKNYTLSTNLKRR